MRDMFGLIALAIICRLPFPAYTRSMKDYHTAWSFLPNHQRLRSSKSRYGTCLEMEDEQYYIREFIKVVPILSAEFLANDSTYIIY